MFHKTIFGVSISIFGFLTIATVGTMAGFGQIPGSLPTEKFFATYFGNMHLSGLPLISLEEAVVNHQWRGGSPHFLLPADRFSARFEGLFYFEEGRFRFSATADDGVRMWVNNILIIDGWKDQPVTNYAAEISLAEGLHLVKVEYYEHLYDATLKVRWDALDLTINDKNLASALGINIGDLTYWSTESPLINVFKNSGGWYTSDDTIWDTGEQALLDLDPRGWPRSLPEEGGPEQFRYVTALMYSGAGGHYPEGLFTVLYEGEGEIEYLFDARKMEHLSQPGRHILDVAPSNGGFALRITATDPNHTGNYIRNIRVLPPGGRCGNNPFHYAEGQLECGLFQEFKPFEEIHEDQIFHPLFLRDLQKYRVIRFMDFTRTNTNQLVHWQDRPRLETFRWNFEEGAPMELVFHLARMLNADAWINIPTRASDDYVLELAHMAQTMLHAGQRVYVEYANEIWNTAFPAGEWVQEQGEAQWPAEPASGYTKRINWYGKRAAEVVGLFKQAWGVDQQRIVGVMGGFAVNDWVSMTALDCPLWAAQNGGIGCDLEMDALAIAPYFGGYLGRPEYESYVNAWTQEPDGGLNRLFEELNEGGLVGPNGPVGGALARIIPWLERSARVADERGLDLIAYEGGQHLVGAGPVLGNAAISRLFMDANRDDRITDLYERYLQEWSDRGGKLMCHYTNVGGYSPFGSWGTKEYTGQLIAPKFDSLMNFIDGNPCWWSGCGALPSILEHPTDQVVQPGQPLYLSVVATGADLVYQWYKDGVPISGADETDFRVDAFHSGQMGAYKCTVANESAIKVSINAQVSSGY